MNIIPEEQYWNNTKLAQTLTQYEGLVNSGNYSIKVLPGRSRSKQVDLLFCLMSKEEWLRRWNAVQPEDRRISVNDAPSEEQQQKSSSIRVTSYDLAVLDSIYTLYLNNRFEFTARQLLLTMSGEPGITSSSERKRDIEESIEKMRNLYLIIDCSEEFKRRKESERVIHGYLLNVEKNGNKYRLVNNELSPLYRYANITEQLIKVRSSFLKKPTFHGRELSAEEERIKKLQTTNNVILLKREILRHLMLLASDKNDYNFRVYYYLHMSNNGVDNGLFRRAGIERGTMNDSVWRNKYRSLNETVETILMMLKMKKDENTNLPLFYKYEMVQESSNSSKSEENEKSDRHPAVGFSIILNENQNK